MASWGLHARDDATSRPARPWARTFGSTTRTYRNPIRCPPTPRTSDTLFATSDVIAVHAPSTPETAGLIGASQLALLHDGASFINTARSTIVDMDALYTEVSSGRIDAALDVFDLEPLPADDRWSSLPNALLTPHLGGATADSRRRAGLIVVDELRRFLSGLPMEHALTRTDLEKMG